MEPSKVAPHNRPRKFSCIGWSLVVLVMLVLGVELAVHLREWIMVTPARSVVRREVGGLSQAMDAFRDRFGTYPPGGDPREFERGIAKVFPQWRDYRADFKAAGLDLAKVNDSLALVFWLGGTRRTPRSTELTGFSYDPAHPFAWDRPTTGPFYNFDQKRLVEADGGWLEYVVEPPADYKPPYQFNGKEVFLPGFEFDRPQR